MRALDNDMSIRALITACDIWAVDTKEDLNKVAQIMGVSIETAVEQDG